MPKVQKGRKRATKAEPFDTMMVDEAVAEEPVDHVEVEAETEETGESNHAIFKRHAGEWKKMKSQVAQLKRQRKTLSKKKRDRKKSISQEIKILIASLQKKHDEELRTLGLIAPKREDLMVDDDDE
jgi:hypothetical protein